MKNTIIAIVIAILLIVFAFSLGSKKSENLSTNEISNNVTSITNNTNTETEPLKKDNDTEAKNINEAGKLMDAKYKILEKFGVEINYIGMGLMPFLRNDRIEDIKNKRNKKVDINADKHE